MSTARRRWFRVLGILTVLAVGVPVLVLAALQIPPLATWAGGRLLTLVPLSPGHSLDVGRVSGSWLAGLHLRELELRSGERTLARVERLRARYSPLGLLGSERRLRSLEVDGARIDARRHDDGWDLARAFGDSNGGDGGGGALVIGRLRLEDVQVAAHLSPDSVVRARDLTLRADEVVVGDRMQLELDTLRATIIPPGERSPPLELAVNGAVTPDVIRLDTLRLQSRRSTVAGRLVLPRNLNDERQAARLRVSLRAVPLALADLSAFVPAIVHEGALRLELEASAEGRLATATLAARLDQSTLRLRARTLLGGDAPALYQVVGQVTALDPAQLIRDAPPGSFTGEIETDLRGDSLAAVDGRAALRLVRSRVAGTTIRSLELAAEFSDGRADLKLDGDMTQGHVTAEGWLRPFDSIPTYQLAGMARQIPGTAGIARALVGDDAALGARFRITGHGVSPEQAALSGRLGLVGLRPGQEPEDLGHATVELEDGRLRARPLLRVHGGRISALLLARLGDTLSYEVREGTIDRVELGRLLADTARVPVSGRFALAGRGIALEEAAATARLQLEEIRYGPARLDSVAASARLRNGRVTLDMAGGLQGGTLAIDAAARPFDSVPTFTVGRAAAEQVDLGSLLGRPDLSGPVTLEGSGSGRWGPAARAVRGHATIRASRMGDMAIAGGTVAAELRGESLTYETRIRTAGGGISLAGRGRAAGETSSLEVERGALDSLDLGQWLGLPDLTTSLDARFTASATGTRPEEMLGRLDLRLLPSRVNDAELGPGTLGLALASGKLQGEVRLEGPDAHLTADLSGELSGELRRLRAGGSLRLERLARWFADTTRDGRLEGNFDLTAQLDSAGLLSADGMLIAAGGVGPVRVQTLYLALTPRTGALAVDTLILRSNVAALDGAGSLALRDFAARDTLRLTGRFGDVSALARLGGTDTVTLDSARVALALTGPPARRRIAGEGSVHRLLYSSMLVEQLAAGGVATVNGGGIGAVAGRVRVEGLATGRVTVREAQFAGRYDSLVTLEGTATLGEDVRLGVGLEGEILGDTTTLRLGRLLLREGGRTWRLARPAGIAIRPGGAVVEQFTLLADGRQLALDGVVALRDSSDLSLRIDNLELGALAKAGLVPLPGTLDGSLHLSGPSHSPMVEGRIALTLHDGDPEDLGRIESKVAWTRSGLRLDATAAHDQGGSLMVSGTLPWGFTLAPDDTAGVFAVVRQPGDTLNLVVRSDTLSLSLFRSLLPRETVRGLGGQLAANLQVRGTPESPTADGGLRVEQLEFDIPALEVGYRRGRLIGRLAGDVLHIDTLVLHTGEDRELAAEGEVRLRPLTDPELDLSAELRRFMVSNSATLRAEASGQMRLTGTLEAPAVTGTLRMGPTEFFAGGAGIAVEEVELTPEDRLELARHFGPGVLAAEGAEAGFLDRFRLSLDLRLPGQVWFRRRENPRLDVEVAGQLSIRQEPGGEMRFFGTVEPLPGRSRLDVYGRAFSLTGGEIVLQGPVEEARVKVTAEYPVPTHGGPEGTVVIGVAASGRPDSIGLEFTSEPEMPQEDMISYIVTGRPSADNPLIGGAENGVGAGEGLVLGQLTEVVAGAVGQELGFDVFQIRQEGTRGMTLTAGRYFTPRLFVSLQQPIELGGTASLPLGTSLGPGFELQYRMRPWLRATIQGGSMPSGVLLRGRYAY